MRRFFSFFFAFGLILTYFSVANAATTNTFDTIMCSGYNMFNGPTGKVFALFALVALGVSFFLGKISWGTVLSVAIGIGAIFGGTAIVNILTGATDSSAAICTNSTPSS